MGAAEMFMLDAGTDFFAPAPFDLIDSLISEYNAHRAKIERLAELMERPDAKRYTRYFVEGNLPPEQQVSVTSRVKAGLFNPVGAVAQLNAEYWSKAFNLTDVYEYMPQSRRNEWSEQIRNPLGVKARKMRSTDPDVMMVEPLPDFEPETVRATLSSLLNSRGRFLAERVDGIFRALSRSHVTNRPEGFSKRMIVPRVVSEWGSLDWQMSGVISDLRCVIAKFMGRDDPSLCSTSAILEHIRKDNGQWADVDGGALRIRIYNGVGTAHIEVHPDMAWRLNAILASIYPAAIPSQFREKPKRQRKAVTLTSNMLPSAVLSVIASMEPALVRGNAGKTMRSPMTLAVAPTSDKHLGEQAASVMAAIGGVLVENRYWQFDYEPSEVVGEILCSGCIPDYKSHQFYPTPENLASRAVELAMEGADESDRWLEPSAGLGGLADPLAQFVPKEQIQLVEVSDLHCKVLESKGFSQVYNGDFIAYAQQAGQTFNRILMNPPYSEGRWQDHVGAAAQLLTQNGRIIAILPASAKGKTLVEGCNHEYTDVLENMFAGTSVSVVIAVITKQSGFGD